MEALALSTLTPRFAGVIWGDAKTGKTTWTMTLPGRKLLVNFDPDGFTSVMFRDDVDVLDLSQLPPLEAINSAKKAGAYILDNADKYTSVVVDSLTTLADLALQDAVTRGIGGSKTFTPTIDAPGLAAYGGRNNNINDVIDRIMRATAQKKLNCFFIAHSDDPEYDEKGENIVQQTIMLTAKVRNKAALKVSEIYYLELIPGNRRVVYLAPHGFKKPMGSRIFDTAKVPRFNLTYTIDEPDETQATSLVSIFNRWKEGGGKKLTTSP